MAIKAMGAAAAPMPSRSLAIGAPVWVHGAAGEHRPGSIGAYVSNADGVWLVSANHVLAANGVFLPQADPRHGVYVGQERISRTVVFSYLRRSGNRADAAACLLARAHSFAPVWPTGWAPSRHPHCPAIRTKVKVSVGGEDRFGTVTRIGTLRVSMKGAGFPCSLGEVEFLDSILVHAVDPAFKRPGNSGLLVVTADTACRPIGIITGTSLDEGGDYVVVSPLAQTLASLGLPNQILI